MQDGNWVVEGSASHQECLIPFDREGMGSPCRFPGKRLCWQGSQSWRKGTRAVLAGVTELEEEVSEGREVRQGDFQ